MASFPKFPADSQDWLRFFSPVEGATVAPLTIHLTQAQRLASFPQIPALVQNWLRFFSPLEPTANRRALIRRSAQPPNPSQSASFFQPAGPPKSFPDHLTRPRRDRVVFQPRPATGFVPAKFSLPGLASFFSAHPASLPKLTAVPGPSPPGFVPANSRRPELASFFQPAPDLSERAAQPNGGNSRILF